MSSTPASASAAERPYRRLDPRAFVATAERLQQRIVERFPESGLSRVAAELALAAAASGAREPAPPLAVLALRAGVGLILLLLLGVEIGTAWWLAGLKEAGSWTDLIQGLDAGLNALILSAGAFFFLITIERRLRRRRTLKMLHRLRTLAHIVQMKQLTKDPERLVFAAERTPSSPDFAFTPFLLSRYLDYCSEMLALIGGLAAMEAQDDDDAVVLDAVDAIESLSTGISQKIWQKMMVINNFALSPAPSGEAPRRQVAASLLPEFPD